MQGDPDSTTDHSLPNQGSQEHSRHFGGRQSSEYWTVETIGIPQSRFEECFSNLLKEQIELLMTQNEKDESGPSTNDAIGKVFGEEHSGRVRCLGMGATPTNTFRGANHPGQFVNSSISMSSTNYSQADFKRLESKFDGTLTALKAYFLSKEGRIPAELTSIFDHGAQANDVENEIITPATGRASSSGGSNENCEDIV
ncbi:hypothetical protein HN51_032443 [Arachis hypogaea]